MASRSAVFIAEEAMAAMAAAGGAALPRETGGILAGFRSGDAVVVTRALVVLDASSTDVTYELRRDHADQALADLRATTADIVGYVGDWHTHPADAPPSKLDRASFARASAAADDIVAFVVLPFANGEPRPVYVHIGSGGAGTSRRHRAPTQSCSHELLESPATELELRAQGALATVPSK